MEIRSIFYDDNDNTFEDGQIEYDISDIMPFNEIMKYKRIGGIYEIVFPIRDTDR